MLNTVNSWIHNCDTKVSILLGVYGAILSIIFSSNFSNSFLSFCQSLKSGVTYLNLILAVILLLSVCLITYGFVRLIIVLIPKIDKTKPSLMFFGGVVRQADNPDVYKNLIKNINAEDDLIYQIYAASAIATQKFSNQKKGTIFSSIGLALFIIYIVVTTIFF